jgi:hypothetical protein
MKFVFLFSTFLLFAFATIAQETTKGYSSKEIQTIMNQKNGSNGGYGAFHIGYSEIAGRSAINTGVRGGWVANHKFTLGIAGNGFFSDKRPTNVEGLMNYITGGYGGLFIEPIVMPMSEVHISFPIIIGAGGIAMLEGYDNMYDWEFYPPTSTEAAAFFICEPGAEVEFNMTKFFRVGLGVSYRITSDIVLSEISPYALRGWGGHIVFKFGKF